MKVFLGLGNPGKEYANTRHNVGWWVLDHLADVWRLDGWRKDGEALTSSGSVGAIKVRLVKPQTFMNLSGAVLKPWLRRPFWAAATDLLVISDEVQLPVGTYRFRARGSAGGHNGLKSIEQALGSQEYARLRIGVGPSDPQRRVGDLAEFVLGEFGKQEAADTRALLPTFETALQQWAKDGIGPVMNTFNSTT
ncbi:MAG: aminoacyl-tRNA hydrolase [Gemmatimonadaceae bacterium]|nr:aminoacyl-tRNA hydrolase [Gemmatimonadaceae bacterium]